MLGEGDDKDDFQQLRRLKGQLEAADGDAQPRGIVRTAHVEPQAGIGQSNQHQGDDAPDRPEGGDELVVDLRDDDGDDQARANARQLHDVAARRAFGGGIDQGEPIQGGGCTQGDQHQIGVFQVEPDRFSGLGKQIQRAPPFQGVYL